MGYSHMGFSQCAVQNRGVFSYCLWAFCKRLQIGNCLNSFKVLSVRNNLTPWSISRYNLLDLWLSSGSGDKLLFIPMTREFPLWSPQASGQWHCTGHPRHSILCTPDDVHDHSPHASSSLSGSLVGATPMLSWLNIRLVWNRAVCV